VLDRRCQLLSGSPLTAFDALSELLRGETRLQASEPKPKTCRAIPRNS